MRPYITGRMGEDMTGDSTSPKSESFTFRLDSDMKAALAKFAAEEQKRPGDVLRELIADHLARRERSAFQAEARRQCLLINDSVRDPRSDEARVVRELEANLDEIGDAWK